MSKFSLAALALGIAVGAVGIATAGIALTRSPITKAASSQEQGGPAYTEQEVTSAVQAVCNAHSLIDRATDRAASQTSDEPEIRGLLSLNVRIGAIISSNYIVETVAKFPATPQDLVVAARDLALAYNRTTLLQIAEASDAELREAYDALDAADAKVIEACN